MTVNPGPPELRPHDPPGTATVPVNPGPPADTLRRPHERHERRPRHHWHWPHRHDRFDRHHQDGRDTEQPPERDT
ncbi:hypothetical protein BX265_0768 [Streptomyces sp. TLI_235]|nr:hypothetical protein [Streptomyces sp. TLI_235]PBC76070.1 hypothetical protein BX265_0768 [Streptomyces sp. TLI_235]